MQFVDLTGKRFGNLVVVELAPKTKNRSTVWVCKCDCGGTIIARSRNLIEGLTYDCGCVSKRGYKEGEKVSRLTLVKKINYGRGRRWCCVCECGNHLEVCESSIREGAVKSCGCLKKEYSKIGNVLHGFNKTRIQNIYGSMIDRCYRESHIHYKNYGARGITICDEWLGINGLKNFGNWALANGYSDELSIDRINNDKGYSPENCRWATREQQQNNTRYNKKYQYKGETLSLSQLARKYNMSISTLHNRVKRYGDIIKAIEEPIHIEKRRIKKEGGN